MGFAHFFALTAILAVGVVPAKAHQRLVYSYGVIEVYDTVTGDSTVISRLGASKYGVGGDPRWSPDGRRIVFAGENALLSVRSDGTAPRQLVAGTTYALGWSSDGRWVAYQASLAPLRSDLRIVRKDGTGMHRISTATTGDAVWIPGTHRMVVARDVDFVHDIVTVGAGAKLVVIPHTADGDEPVNSSDPADDPAVSRNGRWLAFTKNDRIYVERFNGTGFHAVTADKRFIDREPAWSQDGKQLSFTRNPSRDIDMQHGAIMVVGVDGSGLRPVSRQVNAGLSSWSPDGNFISYTRSTTDRGDQLIVTDLRTGHARMVGFFDGNREIPDWAPNG